jgi:hypothetical protein
MRVLTLILLLFSFLCNGQSLFHTLLSDDARINISNVKTVASTYSEASILSASALLYAPNSFWDDGKTYFSLQKNLSVSPFGQIGLVVYDENLGLNRSQILGKPLASSDTHTRPSIYFDNNRLYAVQENLHITPLDIYRSDYDNDTESFTEQVEKIGTEMAYANIYKLASGNFAIYYRFGAGQPFDTKAYASVIKSTSGFSSFGSTLKITERTTTDVYQYPTQPNNATVGVWHYCVLSERTGPGLNPKWYKFWLMKTQDFITFYNYSGSFSKNVTSAAITESELNTNYAIFTGVNTKQYYAPATCLDNDGNFYSIVGDGDETGTYQFIYNLGAGFVTNTFNIANSITTAALGAGDTQGGAIVDITAYSGNEVEILIRIDEGSFTRIQRYRTTDFGVTWNFVDSPYSSINTDFFFASYPKNLQDIPINRNFPIIGSQFAGSGAVNLYFVIAAKGTVQEEPGTRIYDTVGDLNDLANCAIHYEVEAGKITNTGTTLNSLIDQSGNSRTGTPSGSPVIDNATTPTTLTFDGVDDLITISTAGLTASTEATFVFVIKSGTFGRVVSFGNTSDATKYVLAGYASSKAYFRAQSTGTNGIDNFGQKLINDSQFHIMSVCVKQNIVYLYVDGVRQQTEFASDAGTGRANVGQYLDNISGINSLVLGALKRTTTTYGDFQMKEFGYFTRFLSDKERYGAEVMLGTKYGITLGTDQFQN